MQAYRINDAELQIPDEWKDTSIHAFVLPSEEGGGAASFVITRDTEAGEIELEIYADQQLVKSAQQLPSYSLLKREKGIIAGKPAIQSDYTWLAPERISIRQRQACLRNGRSVMVLTLTARDSTFLTYEPAWSQVIGSFKFPSDQTGK